MSEPFQSSAGEKIGLSKSQPRQSPVLSLHFNLLIEAKASVDIFKCSLGKVSSISNCVTLSSFKVDFP